MRHIIFESSSTGRYPVALLVKESSFIQNNLVSNYLIPWEGMGIPDCDVIGFNLKYNEHNKAPVKFIKEYLDNLLPVLDAQGVTHLYVADGAYFKVLAKVSKAEPHWGYVLPCKYPGFEHLKVVLGLNYQALVYNPTQKSKLTVGLQAIADDLAGCYVEPGTGIIHSAHYPETLSDIKAALDGLHKYPILTADIETFSLRFNEAGVGTISFAWDQHNGIAFACDYYPVFETDGTLSSNPYVKQVDIADYDGFYDPNQPVRQLLRQFFETYQGKIIWHNAAFDVKILIYALWMNSPLDTPGLLTGLEIMTRLIDDTKIIAYLATNSTAGNVLALKPLAHDFAGNYAVEDIKDIRKVPLKDLLQYNLVDALSTWYVHNKYYPIMVQDQQETLYSSLMLPSLKLIIQMELTGMPMNAETVSKNHQYFKAQRDHVLKEIHNDPIIKTLTLIVQTNEMDKANAKLKTKQHPIEHFADKLFNPDSDKQMQRLLYDLMSLPVIDLTDTKQPSVSGKTIKKLMTHPKAKNYLGVLKNIRQYADISTLLSTFFPAFERGVLKTDGARYLHGSFNIGGTVSGRLSSSDPNMQNIPAGSKLAPYIKECFQAPSGWLFAGADFSSLEDRINALLTKDPAKLKVYTDGFDGHCLRAFSYFKEQMPDIEETVASINGIENKYPQLRQDSKGPTFLLTYGGTWHGLVKNAGMSEEQAKQVEARYHSLYAVSGQWVKEKIAQAAKQGYVEVAFGLRVRTPLLEQVLWGSNHVPYEAQAEARTLGNAVSGQSYGLLNNRAAVDFFKKVWASPYRYDIKPVALIHDAIYILIRNEVSVVEWANRELIKSMSWQELPEIAHNEVKLGAELDIYYPSWNNPITLPNDATQEEIISITQKAMEKFESKQKQAA